MPRDLSPLVGIALVLAGIPEAQLSTALRGVNAVRGAAPARDHQTALPGRQETHVGRWTRADERALWNAELYNRPMRRF
ncbi:hypothetical protein [Methylobacterium nigriterrae]|uniref:hypothetical protein n=1 Tax=Methylobacterium nigriterrae TaxID=3127512 RepID=UPI003013C979